MTWKPENPYRTDSHRYHHHRIWQEGFDICLKVLRAEGAPGKSVFRGHIVTGIVVVIPDDDTLTHYMKGGNRG